MISYTCKHCEQEFDVTDKPKNWKMNHSRWCPSNPRSQQDKQSLKDRKLTEVMNAAKAKSGYTNNFSKAKLTGQPIPESKCKGKVGHFKGKKHTEESKAKMSESARRSKHRRLKRNVIQYKGVTLDSNWELVLAKRLDQLKCVWIRPEPIPWVDLKGLTRNYFPDFYLPDYNIFLDPKNPFAFKVQQNKIEILMKTYDNLFFLKSLQECEDLTIDALCSWHRSSKPIH